MSGSTRRDPRGGTETKDRVEVPRQYKVVLLNDDFTSMEFVVHVLMSVFHHGSAAATRIMLSIHRGGSGVAGVSSLDVAETRADQVHRLAVEAGYPLMAVVEPE